MKAMFRNIPDLRNRLTRQLLLGASAVVLLLPLAVQAQDYSYKTNRGALTLTKYTGPAGNVVIPSNINGLPVTTFVAELFDPVAKTMTSVTIPTSIIWLPMWAIEHCDLLTTVNIPASVTRIDGAPFYSCRHLKTITVDSQNPCYSSVDGVLYDKQQTLLVQYPCAKTGHFRIPESVTNIHIYSMYGSVGVSSITIPPSIKSLPGFAAGWGGLFSACTALTNIVIPDSVTNIGANAFNNCTRLASITLPENIVSIGSNAFRGTALAHVAIPRNVTCVGDSAFQSCLGLTNLFFKGNAPSLVPANASLGTCRATVYYLPEATGWGPTFGGRPTAIWKP